MDVRPTESLTFLSWIADDESKSSTRQIQASRRNQHTALVSHRRRRARKGLDSQTTPCAENIDAASLSDDSTLESSDSSISRKSTQGILAIPKQPKARTTPADLQTCSSSLSPHPQSLLDSNRFGPFNVFSVENFHGDSQRTFDHALIHQWPSYALKASANAIMQIQQTAISSAMRSPCTLWSIVYAGALYRSYFCGKTKDEELLQLQSKATALKYLSEAMRETECQPSDDIILAISLLTIHGAIRDRKSTEAPVQLYRDNEFYSSVDIEPAHLKALRQLVASRGGLPALKLHGLATMIAMIDIFQSLMHLTKPVFPSIHSTNSLCETFRRSWDALTISRFSAIVDGFSFLQPSDNGQRLHKVIQNVRVLLHSYDQFLRSPRTSPDIMLLVYARRSTQHDALQIDPLDDPVLEVTRLALLIYLAENIQPLPLTSGFHKKVTHYLIAVIGKCEENGCWMRYQDLLLWATVLAGFAARHSSHVLDFARFLQAGGIQPTKDKWAFVKVLSQRFLPLDFGLGDLCHEFWDDACEILGDTPAQT